MKNKKYLTTKEAAEYLGYSDKTLANFRHKGIGPKFKRVRGRRLYDIQDLINWVESKNSSEEV